MPDVLMLHDSNTRCRMYHRIVDVLSWFESIGPTPACSTMTRAQTLSDYASVLEDGGNVTGKMMSAYAHMNKHYGRLKAGGH